jgi:hypothetical protein
VWITSPPWVALVREGLELDRDVGVRLGEIREQLVVGGLVFLPPRPERQLDRLCGGRGEPPQGRRGQGHAPDTLDVHFSPPLHRCGAYVQAQEIIVLAGWLDSL